MISALISAQMSRIHFSLTSQWRLLIALWSILIVFCIPVKSAASFGENSETNGASQVLENPLTATARFQPSTIEAGGTSEVLIDLHLAEGYHAYLDRFQLSIEAPDDLKLAPHSIEPVVKFKDVVSKTEKEGVAGRANLKALIEVPVGFHPGDQDVKLKLVYQACTDEYCLFPKTLALAAPLKILANSELKNEPSSSQFHPLASRPTNKPESSFETALKSSLFSAFLLVFVVGFLTSLTPCVYPMIPITLAVLGARAKHHSHLKNFSLAVIYVCGIALTYAVLGLLAATTGGLVGSALTNSYVVTAIAAIFIAMGLGMLGVFEMQAPAFIRKRLGQAHQSSGYRGAFTTGLLAGVVASPCIGPVLVSVLAFIAQTGDQVLGFSFLFVFAIGMGLPFLALGLSSSWIAKLPKAGPWMDGVKDVFGIVMIGMGFYYVWPIYPLWLLHLLLGLAMILFGSYFGAFESGALTSIKRIRKGLMLAVLVAGLALVASGTLTKAGVLKSDGWQTVTARKEPLMGWQPYSDSALNRALENGQPVIIDFGAEWCAACKEMDEITFRDPNVLQSSLNFVLLKFDGTEDSPELQALVKRYGLKGFPTYIFYDKKGSLRSELTLNGFEKPELFLKRMLAALQ